MALLLALASFIALNFVSFMHAYRFTHFSDSNVERTKDPKLLSVGEKLEILFLGIDNPKPVNKRRPTREHETIIVDNALTGWQIRTPNSLGTVILFHGYAGEKSSLLERSEAFLQMGYSVLLVDFKGSGESTGQSTSIGYHEADQVKQCYNYLVESGEENIYLFGTSMGATAILKCIHDHAITPKAVVLECPFGSLYTTTCARFRNMNIPSFPMAALLVFWGGVQNDFWAFGHNPTNYAEKVAVPALLIFGEQDDRVSRDEIDTIYTNLKGEKRLVVYPESGHNDLFHERWVKDVDQFMRNTK